MNLPALCTPTRPSLTPASITPWAPSPGTEQTTRAQPAQSPLRSLEGASPKPAHPALAGPSHGSRSEGARPPFPPASSASRLAPALPCLALCHVLCLLFPGTCEWDKLLPLGQAFLCLRVLRHPLHTNPRSPSNDAPRGVHAGWGEDGLESLRRKWGGSPLQSPAAFIIRPCDGLNFSQ